MAVSFCFSGIFRAAFARTLALALVLAVLMPGLSLAGIEAPAERPAPQALAAPPAADSVPLHNHGGCCLETLQHGWYRHAEVVDGTVVARLPGRRAAPPPADESGRSVGHPPLRKPPRA